MKSSFSKIYLLSLFVLISLLFPITAVSILKIFVDSTGPTCKDHPKDITVKNIGSDGIKFSWTRPACWNNQKVQFEVVLTPILSNCTAYIYRNKAYVKSNFFVIHNLLPNTKYRYSTNLNNWAFSTGHKSVRINPGPPRNIQTKYIKTNGFKISWIKPKDWFCNSFRFEIVLSAPSTNYYNTTLNECGIKLNEIKSYTINSMQDEHEIKGLLPYVEYKYWFRLKNAWPPMNTTNLVRTKPSVPEKIENVSYNVQQNKVIRISWKPPCRINGNFREFLLNVAENTNQSKLISRTYRTKKHFYDLDNITSSINYVVSIQAVLDSNITGQVKNITLNSGHISSDPPQNISVSKIGSNSFSLSWNKPRTCFGNIKNYNIHLESLENMNCHKQSYKYNRKISADDFYTNFDNLFPNSKYNVKMKVITESGDGDWSPDINFQTASEQKKNFAVTNIRVNQQIGSVDLNWYAPCRQKGLIKKFIIKINGIYSANDSEIYTMSKNINFSKETFLYSLSISDLIPSCNYTAQIFVISANGIEEKFSEETFSLHSGIPEPPSIVELNVSDNFLMLSWKNSPTPVGEIVKYQIYVIPPHNYCNTQESLDVELLTDLNQTYYTVSIAASTGENRTGLPRNETRNVIYGSSSDDYDASLTLEWIAFCKQSKTIKRFDIIIEKNYNKINVKVPDNFNELVKSHFQLKNQYGTAATNYTVRILIQFENEKGKVDNDSTKEANESSEIYLLTISIVLTCNLLIILNVSCYLYQKNKIQFPINYWKENILIKDFNKYYKKLINDPMEIGKQFNDIDDLTRIKFEMLCNNSSDQLNGSFIKGYSGKDEYIAIQEPTKFTSQKFWNMILRENIELIVMVSQFDENNLENGFQYIPSHQKTMKISIDTEIQCTCEQNFETHCIRTLQLRKDCVQRNIIHMQLLDWPDGGVSSNMENYLNFCKNIRERFKKGLIVVQSSSGAGRTGTLIATDILLQTITSQKSINIYRTVLELRMQRLFMVQTEDQYKFIHSCIKEELASSTRNSKMKEVSEPTYENVENSEVVTLTPLLLDEPIYEEIV